MASTNLWPAAMDIYRCPSTVKREYLKQKN